MEFDLSTPVRAILALILVVGLIGLVVWLVRRFNTDRLGNASARGRQPRLAVIDAAAVDGRRRLVLIRRDNVEHLLMIGGPTDVVVELNIVRAAAPAREPQPVRPPPAADPLPRPVPLGEGTMWPLQPEPVPRSEPVARTEPAPRPEPTPRPPRASVPMVEEPGQWSEPEAPPPPATPRERRARAADPLAGLAEELARTPAPAEPAPGRAAAVTLVRSPRAASAAARARATSGIDSRRVRAGRFRRPEPRRYGTAARGRVASTAEERGRTSRARRGAGGAGSGRERGARAGDAHTVASRAGAGRAWRAAVRTRSRAGGPAEIALRQPRAGDGEPARTSGREILTAHCPSAE